MGLILNTLEDFNQAVELIESWNQETIKKIDYKGGGTHTEPDLSKPYGDYNQESLTIGLGSLVDNSVVTILDGAEIPYTVDGDENHYAF